MLLIAVFMYLISQYAKIIIFLQTMMETEKVWIKTEGEEEAGEVTPFFSEEGSCVEFDESERYLGLAARINRGKLKLLCL